MRLSQEDEKDGLSASILSQRNILKDFIKNDERLLAYEQIEFIDDGYSGYSFNRPAITELIELVRNGEIHCIIVKDISRFGRNHLEVLPYIEKIFPFMNVKFVSVTDRLDTSKEINTNTAMDVSIKSMIHEFYVKDLSKKMKSANRVNAKKGKNTAITKPFGYVKDESDKHKIVIDEEAAETVRLIFDYAYNGKNASEIAFLLNKNNFETPLKYWKRKGISNNVVTIFGKKASENIKVEGEKDISNHWTHSSVNRILKNEFYIGTYVAYRRERTEINGTKSIKKDESEWIKVFDAHEPIVDKEIFYAVKEKFFDNKPNRKKYAKPHIFARKVYCGHCGRGMKITGRNKNGFQCCGKSYTEEENCFSKPIQKKDVEDKVFETLKGLVEVKLSNESKKVESNTSKTFNDVAEKSESQIKKEMVKLNSEAKKLFEKFINGKVTEKYFETETQRINELKKALEIDKMPKESNLKLSSTVDEIVFSGEIDILNIEVREKDLINEIFESNKFFDDMVKLVKRVVVYGEDRIKVEVNMG